MPAPTDSEGQRPHLRPHRVGCGSQRPCLKDRADLDVCGGLAGSRSGQARSLSGTADSFAWPIRGFSRLTTGRCGGTFVSLRWLRLRTPSSPDSRTGIAVARSVGVRVWPCRGRTTSSRFCGGRRWARPAGSPWTTTPASCDRSGSVPRLGASASGASWSRVVEAWARRSGSTRLRLAVIPGNEPAVTLYQRRGFDFSGELGDPLSDDGVRERVMVKSLR